MKFGRHIRIAYAKRKEGLRLAGMIAGCLPLLRPSVFQRCLTALSGRNNNFLGGLAAFAKWGRGVGKLA